MFKFNVNMLHSDTFLLSNGHIMKLIVLQHLHFPNIAFTCVKVGNLLFTTLFIFYCFQTNF